MTEDVAATPRMMANAAVTVLTTLCSPAVRSRGIEKARKPPKRTTPRTTGFRMDSASLPSRSVSVQSVARRTRGNTTTPTMTAITMDPAKMDAAKTASAQGASPRPNTARREAVAGCGGNADRRGAHMTLQPRDPELDPCLLLLEVGYGDGVECPPSTK